MKKQVVVTYQSDLLSVSEPTFRKYAERISAELVVLDTSSIVVAVEEIHKLLAEGNTVLLVDPRCLISEKAPNIFEEVPGECVGVFNEVGWRDCSQEIEQLKKIDGFSFKGKLYNTSVVVLKPCHADFFKHINELMLKSFGLKYWLNYILNGYDNIHELSHLWNRLPFTMIRGEDPYMSHIVCFEGMDQVAGGLEKHMSLRLAEWRKVKFDGRRWFQFVCSGGMGNQIATCPTIEEFARQNPDAKIHIHTTYPDAFKHLSNVYQNVIAYSLPGANLTEEERVKEEKKVAKRLEELSFAKVIPTAHTLPLDMTQMHSVDYHAISVLGRQLHDKTIRIYNHTSKLIEYELRDKKVAVIHAGINGWESKAVPRELYQGIHDGLKEMGFYTVIVGKKEFKEHGKGYGAYELEGADLNALDVPFDDFMTILKCADLVVSNDSMPIHAAGATDAWIACLTIAKHPNLIFPYRNGSNSYKTIPITGEFGKNLWEILPDPAYKLPNTRHAQVNEKLDGMEWPSVEQAMQNLKFSIFGP